MKPKKNGWMVNDDYTNMEGVAIDEEAIEFDNCNNGDQENGDNDDCEKTTMMMTTTTPFTARLRQQRRGRKGQGQS
jgi:hypothetical protein